MPPPPLPLSRALSPQERHKQRERLTSLLLHSLAPMRRRYNTGVVSSDEEMEAVGTPDDDATAAAGDHTLLLLNHHKAAPALGAPKLPLGGSPGDGLGAAAPTGARAAAWMHV